MPKFSAYMKGADGSVGPPGASIIDGVLAEESMLPIPNQNKVAFLVGTSNPKRLWVWNDQKQGNNKWEDQGATASKIGNVSANVTSVAWNTSPSVNTQFSTSNQIDYINFNFGLPEGRPAGFGLTNATIGTVNWNAQPQIAVTTDGENWAKNFHFNFKIPVGRPAGFGNINVTTDILSPEDRPWVKINSVTNSPEYQKDFNFEFGLPAGIAAGFSTGQHVSVSTLDTGEEAIVEITTVTSSPETAKEFNFHFGLPRGDALAIYEGVPFTTEDGIYYHWETANNITKLIFNRGTAKKIPIYIYNNNNESIAATFKLSNTTIEYETDQKFDGVIYLAMPTTLQNVEIGTVSSTTYGNNPIISKSTGSTSTNLILDFTIPEGPPSGGYLYGECETAGNTVAKTVTIAGFKLIKGTTIFVKFKYANLATNPTLNVNNTGAKQIYRWGTTSVGTSPESTGWQDNSIIALTYDGSAWIEHLWQNTIASTYTIYGAYCTTVAGTAAKVASCTYYELMPGYFEITMQYANTAQSALTLNIANKGAKPIYINGTISSPNNYTLPAGVYIVYYDGTNYYFRTDGKIEKLQTTLNFDTTPTANSINPVTSNGIKTALDTKVNSSALGTMATKDDVSSTNDVVYGRKNAAWYDLDSRYYTESEINTKLDGKQDTYTQNSSAWDTIPTINSVKPVTSGGIKTALNKKVLHLSVGTFNSFPKTISNSNITTTMKVVNITWSDPSAIISSFIDWNTNTAGSLVLGQSAIMDGQTAAEIDLIDYE